MAASERSIIGSQTVRRTNRRRRPVESPLRQWMSWRGVIVYLAVFVLVVVYFLTLTHIRGIRMQLGYDISNNVEKIEILKRDIVKLEDNKRRLLSREYLNVLAQKLSLALPKPEQVVRVND